MMNKLLPAIIISLNLAICSLAVAEPDASSSNDAQVTAATDDGFLPVDPAKRTFVNGKKLMLTAYAVILGVLLAYSVSIWRRERKTGLAAQNLQQRLKNKNT